MKLQFQTTTWPACNSRPAL